MDYHGSQRLKKNPVNLFNPVNPVKKKESNGIKCEQSLLTA